MIFLNVVIFSGVVYAGVKTFIQRPSRNPDIWLSEAKKIETPPLLAQPEPNMGQNLALSSVSLGLSVTGTALGIMPLNYASVPLNLYSAIPLMEQSLHTLIRNGRGKRGLVVSGTVLGVMSAQYYLIASLVDWSYHFLVWVNYKAQQFNRKLLGEFEHYYRQALYQFLNSKPSAVWVQMGEVEVSIPFDELNIGDVLILDEYNIVPVNGVVVQGTATIDRYFLTGERYPVEIKLGDEILTTTVILSGRVYLKVTRI